MKVVSLCCANCGAPLSIKHKVRYVTCNFCDSRLEVHREKDTTYSTIVEAINERTKRLEQSVERLQLSNQLDRLDREWMMRQDEFMVTDKHGHKHRASTTGGAISLALGIAGCGFGFIALLGGMAPCLCFALPFSIALIANGIQLSTKADRYQQALAAYKRRRSDLLARIRVLEQSRPQ